MVQKAPGFFVFYLYISPPANDHAFMKPILISIKVLIQKTYWHLRGEEISMVAAALAFTTAVTLVPFLAVTLGAFKFYGVLDFYYPKVESLLLQYFTGPAGGDATWIVRRSIHKIQNGAVGSLGAVFLVITSTALFAEMEKGINYVWRLNQPRPLHRRLFFYWIAILIMPLILAAYAGLLSLQSIWGGYRWLGVKSLGFLLLSLILFGIFWLVPATKVLKRNALIAAMLSTIAFAVLKSAFGWIMDKVLDYDRIYGSIATLPIFLIWILWFWYVILGGVALCANLQERGKK